MSWHVRTEYPELLKYPGKAADFACARGWPSEGG
jgi:hypothetical protein